jgi:hypothetical protein
MKNTSKKSVKNHALSAENLVITKPHQPQRITLSMIATELENDLTDLRSRFVRAITKVFGINQK